MTEYHAPPIGDDPLALFLPNAACGATAATEPDGVLRMHAPGLEVTCTECRHLILVWEGK